MVSERTPTRRRSHRRLMWSADGDGDSGRNDHPSSPSDQEVSGRPDTFTVQLNPWVRVSGPAEVTPPAVPTDGPRGSLHSGVPMH